MRRIRMGRYILPVMLKKVMRIPNHVLDYLKKCTCNEIPSEVYVVAPDPEVVEELKKQGYELEIEESRCCVKINEELVDVYPPYGYLDSKNMKIYVSSEDLPIIAHEMVHYCIRANKNTAGLSKLRRGSLI